MRKLLLGIVALLPVCAAAFAYFFFFVHLPDNQARQAQYEAENACTREWNADEVIRKCGDLAARYPNKAGSAYHRRAQAFAEKGDYERAFADVNRAIELEPKQYGFVTTRADFYKAQRNLDRALADYEQAITLAPDRAYSAYVERGKLRADRDPDGAIADFDRALDAWKTDAPASAAAPSTPLRERGWLLQRLKRWDEAIATWDKLIAGRGEAATPDPLVGDYYYFRGLSKYGAGRIDDAKADFRKAIKNNPKSERSRAALRELEK